MTIFKAFLVILIIQPTERILWMSLFFRRVANQLTGLKVEPRMDHLHPNRKTSSCLCYLVVPSHPDPSTVPTLYWKSQRGELNRARVQLMKIDQDSVVNNINSLVGHFFQRFPRTRDRKRTGATRVAHVMSIHTRNKSQDRKIVNRGRALPRLQGVTKIQHTVVCGQSLVFHKSNVAQLQCIEEHIEFIVGLSVKEPVVLRFGWGQCWSCD